MDHISERPRTAYQNCADTAWTKIYKSSDVLDIELAGNRIISVLLDKFLDAVRFPDKAYSRLLLNKVPEQYEVHSTTLYGKVQAVIDYISGMTDVYALDLYRKNQRHEFCRLSKYEFMKKNRYNLLIATRLPAHTGN